MKQVTHLQPLWMDKHLWFSEWDLILDTVAKATLLSLLICRPEGPAPPTKVRFRITRFLHQLTSATFVCGGRSDAGLGPAPASPRSTQIRSLQNAPRVF